MPTTKKSGKKKAAYKKTAPKKKPAKPAKKGGKAGGGGKDGFLPSGDPIIITGGGSVKLKFSGKKFKGKDGDFGDSAADLDNVVINDPLNPPSRTISVSPKTVITINFK
ncbi:MAG: hypothetical protein QOH63_1155 [Acidobacteriota bacterium]|jgi:hypothetical protein|nr:hypothetical protein [Acidobacteriota bacterium]